MNQNHSLIYNHLIGHFELKFITRNRNDKNVNDKKGRNQVNHDKIQKIYLKLEFNISKERPVISRNLFQTILSPKSRNIYIRLYHIRPSFIFHLSISSIF